jgi:L-threonine kinase
MIPNLSSITIAVPGTCGELVQGWSAEWDEPVLVSCPMAVVSRVSVKIRPGPAVTGPAPAPHYAKSRRAARLLLDHLHRPGLGAALAVASDLLPGRGMASSTADIIGVMAGLALSLGRPITPAALARLACRIEPSDSTMFGPLTALAYRGSARFAELGPAPALPLLMLDTGQAVDTLAYNARLNLDALRRLAPTTTEALALLSHGLTTADYAALGAAATLSAVSYQAIQPQPWLDQARRWAADTGALGVVRAHSGSVLGLLYPPHTPLTDPARWLSARFDGAITLTGLVAGGWSVCPPPARHVDPPAVRQSTLAGGNSAV